MPYDSHSLAVLRNILGSLAFAVGCNGVANLAAAETNTVSALKPTIVSNIKVLPDKVADCSSLKAIVDSVTRDCKTNDEKAIAIYNFMRLTHYHRAYPSEPGGIPVLKEINCYGWSLCGGLHAEQSALWRELGWNWRFVGWPGHTTVEAFYDGRWHYLDVFLKFYAWMPDPNNPGKRTIAGEDDLAANPQELLVNAFVFDKARKVMYAKGNEFELNGEKANWQAPAFLVCGDDIPGVIDGVKHRSRVGPTPGWGGMQHATGNYSAEVNLSPGFSLTNTWDKFEGAWYWAGSKIAPCHTCGDKEIRNSPEKGPIAEPYLSASWNCESYANGLIVFRPDLSSSSCLASFAESENVKVADGRFVPVEAGKAARLTIRLQSPYILTQASGSAEGLDQFEISIDDGKTWKKAVIEDFGAAVGGQVKALARCTFQKSLQKLRLQATVQNNPFSLPYLSPGKNSVTISVADPAALGDNNLVVTYAYRTGSRRKSYEQLCLEGKEIARGHDAQWNDDVTVVQKSFTARELPAKFDIDIATPRGQHPVFPRMVFVRREVVGPRQEPLPLPQNSQLPESRTGDELKSLPNPLYVGTQPPPARVVRTVTTKTVSLLPSHFVSKSGEVQKNSNLRWPKSNSEKVEPLIFLMGGNLPELPRLKNLAAARLIVPVNRAHPKAPTKMGIVGLLGPIAKNKPYDFEKLGDVLSTTIVPALADDAPSWSPPKEFALDVTGHLRSVIMNDTSFHGFGIRVVPDRSVDDGWTVRVQVANPPTVRLEIDIFSE